MRAFERIARARQVVAQQLDQETRHQLEAGQPAAAALARDAEEPQRSRRVGDPGDRHRLPARPRKELQHRGGDDAERPLRADEELLQVVAGIVLQQAAQPVPDFSGRQHHLQPEHEAARVAVGEHLRAAGIGGDVAADPAGALRAERQRKEHAGLRRGLLQPLQHDARLGDHGAALRVDGADLVEPLERQHDLAPALVRRLPADEPVLPPCGTIGVPVSLASFRIAAISSAEAGLHHRLRASGVVARGAR